MTINRVDYISIFILVVALSACDTSKEITRSYTDPLARDSSPTTADTCEPGGYVQMRMAKEDLASATVTVCGPGIIHLSDGTLVVVPRGTTLTGRYNETGEFILDD